MARFSERFGYVGTTTIQLETMDDALRNSLWNFVDVVFFQTKKFWFYDDEEMQIRANIIYDRFHKRPIRLLHSEIREFVDGEFKWFRVAKWFEVYDYCEFLLSNVKVKFNVESLCKNIDSILEREKSAYRFVGGHVTPIVEKEQLEEIEAALVTTHKYHAASEHIKCALGLYADRRSPDYRNSIKESISAVESVAKIISGNDSATLSDAIKVIDKSAPMHEAFRLALLKLYGYTSDEKGIRHALLDEANVSEADARFMLVACSAFVSYLISRAK